MKSLTADASSTATAQPSGLDPLLTADQVAQLVGVRVDYIWALCRANEIPHLRFGRFKRFRRSAILEWLEQREQGSVS
jgi:excisionase family DNA binding protein